MVLQVYPTRDIFLDRTGMGHGFKETDLLSWGEGGPENPERNLSEQDREPTTIQPT